MCWRIGQKHPGFPPPPLWTLGSGSSIGEPPPIGSRHCHSISASLYPNIFRYFQPLAPPNGANLVSPETSRPSFLNRSPPSIISPTPALDLPSRRTTSFVPSGLFLLFLLLPFSFLSAFPALSIQILTSLNFLLQFGSLFCQEEKPGQFSKLWYLQLVWNFSKRKGVASCPSGSHFIEEEAEAQRSDKWHRVHNWPPLLYFSVTWNWWLFLNIYYFSDDKSNICTPSNSCKL